MFPWEISHRFRHLSGNLKSWILDSTPWIPDSRYMIPHSLIPDSLSFFWIPKSRIPDSTRKNLPDSGIPTPLHGIIEPNPCECKKFSKASKRSYRIRLCGLKVVICLLLVLLQNENNWNTFDIALGKMLSTG